VTPPDSLSDLLERCRKATGPDSSIDVALLPFWAPDHDALKAYDAQYETEFRDGGFSVWKKDGGYSASTPFPRFTASIDAALALTERLLPGWVVSDLAQAPRLAGDPWGCGLAVYYGSDPSKSQSAHSGYDFPTAPLAILVCLLQSLIAKGEAS